jgi:hypothetical protein
MRTLLLLLWQLWQQAALLWQLQTAARPHKVQHIFVICVPEPLACL